MSQINYAKLQYHYKNVSQSIDYSQQYNQNNYSAFSSRQKFCCPNPSPPCKQTFFDLIIKIILIYVLKIINDQIKKK